MPGHYVWVIDQVCSVKMAGYWPSSFLRKLAKKERGQYPAILTEQTWSIKDLLYGFCRGKFACGIQRVVPSGQDGSILPARVANHSARFGSSCLLPELQWATKVLRHFVIFGYLRQISFLISIILSPPPFSMLNFLSLEFASFLYNIEKGGGGWLST